MARIRIPGLGALILVVLLAQLVMPAQAEERVVNVYNWTDYIDPYVVDRFQRESGIRVRYDVYDSLEVLEAKLAAGRSGYDIIVPTDQPTFARMVRNGALQAIDRALVPNWANLDAGMMREVEAADPANRHGAIYLWGTIGLGVNFARVATLAPDAPRDSLSLLFDPGHARRLRPCGIVMMDSQTDVIPTVLRYLGRDPNSTSAEDLRLVERTLLAIRPFIRQFASGGAIEQLASGQACLAFAYSGDVIQAAARAEEAGRGVQVDYVAGREGAQLWHDMLAIPRDAPNAASAHAFINFLLRPDVMAEISNKTRYPNAVPASWALVEPAVRNNPNIFPDAAARARFFAVSGVDGATDRARSRVWARFKAGR
ncbi:MAG: extracellular solute-binding protein [Acetobacteraceae bacterium]|nr:extracellular solute-binding protein [Acetobacteraceae bacterium]